MYLRIVNSEALYRDFKLRTWTSETRSPVSTIHHAPSLNAILFTLQHIKPGQYYQVIFQSCLLVLYSTLICNRGLYSTLLCKVIESFRSLACSDLPCVLWSVQRLMDVSGHVFFVCFLLTITLVWFCIQCCKFSGLTA